MVEYTPTLAEMEATFLTAAGHRTHDGHRKQMWDRFIASVRAQAWDEGALWAAVECGAIAHERQPWLAPGDNPYRKRTDDE